MRLFEIIGRIVDGLKIMFFFTLIGYGMIHIFLNRDVLTMFRWSSPFLNFMIHVILDGGECLNQINSINRYNLGFPSKTIESCIMVVL